MAESDRVRTLVRNLVGARRFSWLPPNGRILNFNELVSIPGVLETEIYLGMNVTQFDEYIDDITNNRVQIQKIGFGGGGSGSGFFSTTIGNGAATLFTIDAGFNTAGAEVYVYDNINNSMVQIYGLELGTPNPTSIVLEFEPAPASGQIDVYIFG